MYVLTQKPIFSGGNYGACIYGQIFNRLCNPEELPKQLSVKDNKQYLYLKLKNLNPSKVQFEVLKTLFLKEISIDDVSGQFSCSTTTNKQTKKNESAFDRNFIFSGNFKNKNPESHVFNSANVILFLFLRNRISIKYDGDNPIKDAAESLKRLN